MKDIIVTINNDWFNPKDVFLVNDVVKCIIPITFVDGTVHNKGDVITVTKESHSYFNMFHNSYVLWHRGS